MFILEILLAAVVSIVCYILVFTAFEYGYTKNKIFVPLLIIIIAISIWLGGSDLCKMWFN